MLLNLPKSPIPIRLTTRNTRALRLAQHYARQDEKDAVAAPLPTLWVTAWWFGTAPRHQAAWIPVCLRLCSVNAASLTSQVYISTALLVEYYTKQDSKIH